MLVIWTVALVALMAFAAMAIDLGNVAQTKQHTNNAVDDAALAGVTELAGLATNSVGTACSMATPAVCEQNAETAAADNLEQNFTAVASDPNFPDDCPNQLPSAIYVVPSKNCFGFFNPTNAAEDSTDPTAMAVAIPTQVVDYTFGKGAGLSSQGVSSVGFASLKTSFRGLILPFGYPSTGTTGLKCLKDASQPSPPDCRGFTSGSGKFGLLNSPRYTVFGPASSSSAGTSNTVVETDMALGIDHQLQISGSSGETAEICDAPGPPPQCPSYNNLVPHDNADYAVPQTGETITELTQPLFTGGVVTPVGSCTLAARLSHPDNFQATSSSSSCGSSPYPTPGPDGPLLSSSEGDTFGSTEPLNGLNISAYLNEKGQELASGCVKLLPSGDTAANTAIDAQSPVDSGNYVWSSYDACLSSVITAAASTPTPIFCTGSYSSDSSQSGCNFCETNGTVEPSSCNDSILASPRFGVVPVVSKSSGTNAEEIVGFDAVYLDLAFPKANGNPNQVDQILAWVFPLDLLDGTTTSGGGLTEFIGGPYTANLCSYTAANC